jgi:hypothetical protein
MEDPQNLYGIFADTVENDKVTGQTTSDAWPEIIATRAGSGKLTEQLKLLFDRCQALVGDRKTTKFRKTTPNRSQILLSLRGNF